MLKLIGEVEVKAVCGDADDSVMSSLGRDLLVVEARPQGLMDSSQLGILFEYVDSLGDTSDVLQIVEGLPG